MRQPLCHNVFSSKPFYPFGMIMPGRSYTATSSYRFGFNDQEKDNEIEGEGNVITFKYRIEDPRLGRFFSIDPLFHNFPGNSPYDFSEDRLLDGIEVEGLEVVFFNSKGHDAGLYYSGMNIKDKSAIHVVGHGDPFEILGPHGSIDNAKDFDKILREKSAQWRNRKNGQTTSLVLHSCRIGLAVDYYGHKHESFAQTISRSKEFHDVNIVAPDARDVSLPDMKSKSLKSYKMFGIYHDTNEDKNGDPLKDKKTGKNMHQGVDLNKPGNWLIYKNGNLVGTISGKVAEPTARDVKQAANK